MVADVQATEVPAKLTKPKPYVDRGKYPPPNQRNRASFIRDALDLQKEMKRMALASDTPVHHKAACARAWTDLCERIRILRGQPMPGVLRPEGSGKRKSSRGKGAESGTKQTENKAGTNSQVPPVDPPAPIVVVQPPQVVDLTAQNTESNHKSANG